MNLVDHHLYAPDLLSGMHNIIVEQSQVRLVNNSSMLSPIAKKPAKSFVAGFVNSTIDVYDSTITGVINKGISLYNTNINFDDFTINDKAIVCNNSFLNFPTPKFTKFYESSGGDLSGNITNY